jgi:hypothetical protein
MKKRSVKLHFFRNTSTRLTTPLAEINFLVLQRHSLHFNLDKHRAWVFFYRTVFTAVNLILTFIALKSTILSQFFFQAEISYSFPYLVLAFEKIVTTLVLPWYFGKIHFLVIC